MANMFKSIDIKEPSEIQPRGRRRYEKNNVENYLRNLEKEIANIDAIVEKEKEFIPEKIELAIQQIIKDEFKAKKFNAFIAQDLFSAYIEAGGRKLLVKHLKQNPKNILNLLKLIIDISGVENKVPENATQINIHIEGIK